MQLDVFQALAAIHSSNTSDEDFLVVHRIIQALLVAAGPRWSDGLHSYRVVEQSPHRVRVCGRIWHIDQTLKTFWLEATREAEVTRWSLLVGIHPESIAPRLLDHAVELLVDPTEVAWVLTLRGTCPLQPA